MPITPKDKLKEYFSKGAYPTEGQFADLIDSMRYTGDRVPMTEIEGLTAALNKKFDAASGNALQTTVQTHNRQIEVLEQMGDKLGLRVAYFDDIATLPEEYIANKWIGNSRPQYATYTTSIIFDTVRSRFIAMLRITGGITLEGDSSSNHSGWSSQYVQFAIPDISDAELPGDMDEDGLIPQQNTIYVCRSNSRAYVTSDSSELICFADSMVIGDTKGTAFDGGKGKELSEAVENVKTAVETAKTFAQGVSNDLDAAKVSINKEIAKANTKIDSIESKVLSSFSQAFDVVKFAGIIKDAEGVQSDIPTQIESTNSDATVYFNSTTKRFYLSVWGGSAYVLYDRWGDADRFGTYNPDSVYFGVEPHAGRIYYSGNQYYYFDGENLVQFLNLSGYLVGSQDYVNKWNITAEGVVDLGKVASSNAAFDLSAEKSITENVKIRQIRWRTSDDNSDGGQGAGGTIFQERYGNWFVTQWIMFEGPNRVCKARTITTGGNYSVSEWQSLLLPAFLTYNMQTRMFCSIGLHDPGENPTDAPSTNMMQLPLVDSTFAGLMSAQDKMRLDALYEHYLNTK